MNRTLAIAIPAAALWLATISARPAAAQVPFFGRGATIFDPEIGVVQSGIVNDVQATVSADRKYVTMTMRAQNAQLLALHEFAFQIGNGGAPNGFVGGAGAAGNAKAAANNGGAANGAPPAAASGGAGGARGESILDRPGMTLIGRANNSRARAH